MSKGPLLIAANHPNSFLDAVIIATLFKRPVHSLVRGDTFKHKIFARILSSLNMLPVYRMSEGSENLGENYKTFDKCKEIFQQNGIVLIFSEGQCINEWKLRPLKKGTARLAFSSWEAGIDLKVLPTGINYQSFTSFGKNIRLNFGKVIDKINIEGANGYGATINLFNEKLSRELKKLVIEIPQNDTESIKKSFEITQSLSKKAALFIPASIGFLIHAPLYLPLRYLSRKWAGRNDHYDSVLIGLLFLIYPLYLIFIAMLIIWQLHIGLLEIILTLIILFCAWSFIQVKKQF